LRSLPSFRNIIGQAPLRKFEAYKMHRDFCDPLPPTPPFCWGVRLFFPFLPLLRSESPSSFYLLCLISFLCGKSISPPPLLFSDPQGGDSLFFSCLSPRNTFHSARHGIRTAPPIRYSAAPPHSLFLFPFDVVRTAVNISLGFSSDPA